jgi:hypothetical protein
VARRQIHRRRLALRESQDETNNALALVKMDEQEIGGPPK